MTSEERDEGSLRLLAALGDIDDRFVMEAACPEATGSVEGQSNAIEHDNEAKLAQEGDRQNGAATAKAQVNMPADVASDAMSEAEGCSVAPTDMLAHSKPETEGPDDVSAGNAPRSAPVEKASVDVSPGKAKGKVLRFTPERVRALAGVGIAACLLVAGVIVFARPEMLSPNNPGPSEPAMMRDQTSDTLSPEEAAPEAAMPEDAAADSEDAGVMAASESTVMALSDDDQIAELTLPTDWADKTIVELNIRRNFGVSVLGIHRGGKFLTSPGAETMLMAGDLLLVMGKKEAISAVQ